MSSVYLSVVVLGIVALALAGCGTGSSSPAVAHISSAKSASLGGTPGEDSSAEGTTGPEQAGLAYAHCMRSHGVPNFPDPQAGGGLFRLGAGIDPRSPTFRSAQTQCQKLMPGGGIGSGPPPSAQTLARFLIVAQCMRSHGVPDFPDPKTSAPSNPRAALGGGGGVISDIEGVILVFPSTIDERSPQFAHAAAACAFPLHNH